MKVAISAILFWDLAIHLVHCHSMYKSGCHSEIHHCSTNNDLIRFTKVSKILRNIICFNNTDQISRNTVIYTDKMSQFTITSVQIEFLKNTIPDDQTDDTKIITESIYNNYLVHVGDSWM